MIASYLLVIDAGPSWKQVDEDFSLIIFSKLHKPKAEISALTFFWICWVKCCLPRRLSIFLPPFTTG